MEQKIDYYDLIKDEKFNDCYSLANEEYKETQSENSLGSRALALMNLRRYEEASNDYLRRIKINKGESQSDYISAGTALWLLEKHEYAVQTWKEGLNSTYTDAAGGVEIPALLFYAATSLHDNILEKYAVSLLKKRWRTKQAKVNFPGSIAGYLIREIDEQELLNSLTSQPVLRVRQSCKVHFYIAVHYLKHGDTGTFYKHLEQCNLNKAYLEKEYYLAIGELDKR